MRPFIILAAVLVFIVVRLTLRYRSRQTKLRAAATPAPTKKLDVPRRSWLASLFGVVGLVAQREVRERIRSRVFQVGTAIILLVVVAAIVIPVLTKSKAKPDQVGVVGVLPAPVKTALIASNASIGDTMTVRARSECRRRLTPTFAPAESTSWSSTPSSSS